MKKTLLTLLILASFSAFAGPMAELSTTEALSAYISQSGFNGVVLAGANKKILFKKAFGVRDFTGKIPLTTDDRFQIGSNTKQFVSASLLKLQEEGKLSLEDSVIQYLPQLTIPADIKIRDILNHTSGITNYTDHRDFWESFDDQKIATLNDLIEFTMKFPLDFEPRTKWNYSNSGFVIAGKIIEQVSGQTWDQFIKENFLIPLEMTNTGYSPMFNNVSDVRGYIANEKGEYEGYDSLNLSWALSAGALYSTVDDLFKWSAIYSDSNLLSEKSKTDMQTPFKNNYGLGLSLLPYRNDINVNHNGRTPGFVSTVSHLKKSDLTIITLDNIDGSVKIVPGLLMNFFMDGKAQVVKLDHYAVDPEKLSDYVGTYAASTGDLEVTVFIADQKLFLQPNDGQPAYELIANDKDSFSLKEIIGEEFVRQGRKVSGIIHYQNGKTTRFIRK